jgi:hypothetical protein
MHQTQSSRYLICFSYEKSAGRRYRPCFLLENYAQMYMVFPAMIRQQTSWCRLVTPLAVPSVMKQVPHCWRCMSTVDQHYFTARRDSMRPSRDEFWRDTRTVSSQRQGQHLVSPPDVFIHKPKWKHPSIWKSKYFSNMTTYTWRCSYTLCVEGRHTMTSACKPTGFILWSALTRGRRVYKQGYDHNRQVRCWPGNVWI